MTNILSIYQLYIINQIEIGELRNYLQSIVSYPVKRKRYSFNLQTLKTLGVVIEMSGELTINASSKIYKKLKYERSGDE
jgi:hypothetical protein